MPIKKQSTIELNEQFKHALDIVENSNRNLLIFGKAGTGKSTFLNFLRDKTKKHIAVLAPTGVAAINIQGTTIHSFFGFSIDITLEKIGKITKNHRLYKLLPKINAIIIDEISMVRADLLDCVNKFLSLNGPLPGHPFGGIQMVFIGDLYQIPPIVKSNLQSYFRSVYSTPYFFSAKVFEQFGHAFELVEFEKIYRQKDLEFISILNAIRNNTVTNEHLAILNSRLNPSFITNHKDFWVQITGTNATVKKINDEMLSKLNSQEKIYYAKCSGEINQESFPTDTELKLKIGAQVMLINNDTDARWVNGSIGHITNIITENNADFILVQLADGITVEVSPHEWDVFKYSIDSETKKLTTEKIGSFSQYPLRLAWAITVHKSQGKTFNQVVINIDNTFVPGQMYVALSRCASLDGLILKKKILKNNIFIDNRIVNFVTKFQYQKSEAQLSLNGKVALITQAIQDNKLLEITYLKSQDEKSKRIIFPTKVGEMSYNDKKFIGAEGICKLRNERRTFRVARILEIKIIDQC